MPCTSRSGTVAKSWSVPRASAIVIGPTSSSAMPFQSTPKGMNPLALPNSASQPAFAW